MYLRKNPELSIGDRATGPLADALDAVPGYTEARDRASVFHAAAAAIPLPTGDLESMADGIDAAFRKGSKLPADLYDRAAAAVAAETGWNRLEAALQTVYAGYEEEAAQLLHSHVDDVTAHLHEQLQATLQTIADTTDAPDDAETAITAGQVDAYQARQAAFAHYRAIRAGQARVMQRLWSTTASLTSVTLAPVMAGQLNVFPDFGHWVARGWKPVRRADTNGRENVTAPWPDPTTDAFAAWLATTPDAEPWVPTEAQYRDHVDQLEHARFTSDGRANTTVVAA